MLRDFLRHRFKSWMGGNIAPSDVLGRLHHPVEGLAVVEGAIPVPGPDSTGQDALDGSAVVFGVDPGCNDTVLQPPLEVETLFCPLHKTGGGCPCQVLRDLDTEKLNMYDSLLQVPLMWIGTNTS
jgi:hypothetical protein